MAKSNVVEMPKNDRDLTLDDVLHKAYETALDVLEGRVSPVKGNVAMRAYSVLVKGTELRCRYGENAKIVLHKR